VVPLQGGKAFPVTILAELNIDKRIVPLGKGVS
jgi:hypothetical protein